MTQVGLEVREYQAAKGQLEMPERLDGPDIQDPLDQRVSPFALKNFLY